MLGAEGPGVAPLPHFNRLINSIHTRGVDYTHHCSPWTFKPSYGTVIQRQYQKTIAMLLVINAFNEEVFFDENIQKKKTNLKSNKKNKIIIKHSKSKSCNVYSTEVLVLIRYNWLESFVVKHYSSYTYRSRTLKSRHWVKSCFYYIILYYIIQKFKFIYRDLWRKSPKIAKSHSF